MWYNAPSPKVDVEQNRHNKVSEFEIARQISEKAILF